MLIGLFVLCKPFGWKIQRNRKNYKGKPDIADTRKRKVLTLIWSKHLIPNFIKYLQYK